MREHNLEHEGFVVRAGKVSLMALSEGARKQLHEAINQVKADLAELEGHVPNWINENVGGTRIYRPIAKQIVHSAQRLEEIVRKYTYS
jgi:hypothetical protein